MLRLLAEEEAQLFDGRRKGVLRCHGRPLRAVVSWRGLPFTSTDSN